MACVKKHENEVILKFLKVAQEKLLLSSIFNGMHIKT